MISVTLEGPLLPLAKKEQYLPTNLSTCYLLMWLQLLVDENVHGRNDTWLSSTGLENLKVSTSLKACFVQNYSAYTHVCVEIATKPTDPETKKEERESVTLLNCSPLFQTSFGHPFTHIFHKNNIVILIILYRIPRAYLLR